VLAYADTLPYLAVHQSRDNWITFFTIRSYPVFKQLYPYPNPVLVAVIASIPTNYPKCAHVLLSGKR